MGMSGWRPQRAALMIGMWLAAVAAPAQSEETLLDALLAGLSVKTADGLASLERSLGNLDPMLAGAAAPLVAKLIVDSRADAVAHGVEPIPAAIRAEIDDYVPARILDRVRWCASCGGTLSLQRNTFRLGIAPAITLDDVIVFADREAALGDPALWVHELKHVMQFEAWGVMGFAARYVEDYAGVEHEAAEYRWEWVQKTDWLERRKAAL